MKSEAICPICKVNPCRSVKDVFGVTELIICKACATERNQAKREQLESRVASSLMIKGVGKRHANAKLTDFPKSLQKLNHDESYCIVGGVGSGKTHLSVALMRESLLDGKLNVEFIPMNELLRKIKACYDNNALTGESQVIEHFSNREELYIDDIGGEKPTDWAISTVFAIIDYRYRNMLKTVITSNLSLHDLEETVGERVVSRIVEMCKVITLEGKDKRLEVRQ